MAAVPLALVAGGRPLGSPAALAGRRRGRARGRGRARARARARAEKREARTMAVVASLLKRDIAFALRRGTAQQLFLYRHWPNWPPNAMSCSWTRGAAGEQRGSSGGAAGEQRRSSGAAAAQQRRSRGAAAAQQRRLGARGPKPAPGRRTHRSSLRHFGNRSRARLDRRCPDRRDKSRVESDTLDPFSNDRAAAWPEACAGPPHSASSTSCGSRLS
jgi:hypothetical protein